MAGLLDFLNTPEGRMGRDIVSVEIDVHHALGTGHLGPLTTGTRRQHHNVPDGQPGGEGPDADIGNWNIE